MTGKKTEPKDMDSVAAEVNPLLSNAAETFIESFVAYAMNWFESDDDELIEQIDDIVGVLNSHIRNLINPWDLDMLNRDEMMEDQRGLIFRMVLMLAAPRLPSILASKIAETATKRD